MGVVATLFPGIMRDAVPAPDGTLLDGWGEPTLAFGDGGLMVDDVEFWANAEPMVRPSTAADRSSVFRISVVS